MARKTRLMQQVDGFEATIVSGVVTQRIAKLIEKEEGTDVPRGARSEAFLTPAHTDTHASVACPIIALATSHGFAGGYTTSGYSAGVSVIAGAGERMQRDHASHSVRHFADLDDPETLGRRAAERALKRLDPAKPPSGTMPVLFDPRVGGSLVGHLLAAMAGPSVARKTSFLLGREDEAVLPETIVVVDDPVPDHGADGCARTAGRCRSGSVVRARARRQGRPYPRATAPVLARAQKGTR